MAQSIESVLYLFNGSTTNSITDSTKQEYEMFIKQFKDIQSTNGISLNIHPTFEYVAAFLQSKKEKGCLYPTINRAISALRYYCMRENYKRILDVHRFNNYRKGVKRMLNRSYHPNASTLFPQFTANLTT